VKWYRDVHDRLRDVGFGGSIMEELGAAVAALEGAG
jgi:hypothetical protein